MVSSALWHSVHVRSNPRSCCFFTQYTLAGTSCFRMIVCMLWFNFDFGLKSSFFSKPV